MLLVALALLGSAKQPRPAPTNRAPASSAGTPASSQMVVPANAFTALSLGSDEDEDAALADALRGGSVDALATGSAPSSRASNRNGGGARPPQQAAAGNTARPHPNLGPHSPSGGRAPIVHGRVPNIHWCATSHDELRWHAAFRALPPVEHVRVGGPSTYAHVRQDDPLWSELHAGVLTSRNVMGALGFCEARAARQLGLQPGMASGRKAESAFWALQEPPPAGCGPPSDPTDADSALNALNAKATTAYNEGLFIATARGGKQGGPAAVRQRHLGGGCSISQVRCAWGSAQEASSLRSLIEDLSLSEPGCYLEEAGLCMLSASDLPLPAAPAPGRVACPPVLASALPPIGASPDGFAVRADGTRQVVEVKNVCPFLSDRQRPNQFCVALDADSGMSRGPHASILVSHVPQLQLEMLCSDVKTGLLVSTSACQGINVFEIERDDDYLSLLLHFLSLFYTRHVLPQEVPGDNFFPRAGDTDEAALYDELLGRTAKLARDAKLERTIAQPWRAASSSGFFV